MSLKFRFSQIYKLGAEGIAIETFATFLIPTKLFGVSVKPCWFEH